MQLTSSAFHNNQPIPGEYAFGVPDSANHVALSDNKNPPLAWQDIPQGTKSLVLICHDPDVPSKPDDVNQENRTVPRDLPRVDFFHWVLVDLAPTPMEIPTGAFSEGITAGGKTGPAAPHGARQGINSYTDWFAGDEQMQGTYFGYDGPCPPWNDSIVHHYIFTLYALDVASCPVEGEFTGPDVLNAIQGHVLDQASVTGLYSLNPDVKT